jgi:hypothetical protein
MPGSNLRASGYASKQTEFARALSDIGTPLTGIGASFGAPELRQAG